jgi:hypothetical protein
MVFKIALVATLALAAACSRSDAPGTASAPSEETTAEDELAGDLQEIIGRVKLVKEEYRDGVRDGAIIDQGEYEEAEMFAEQAALRFRRVADAARARDAEAAARIETGLADLMKIVAAKGPNADAYARVDALLADLAKVNPKPIPPAIEETQATVARADAQIVEQQVEGYRVGLLLGPPRTLYLREPGGALREHPADAAATQFVAIVLREPLTKRFLPAARITLRVNGGAEVELAHLWGEFPLYGENLALPASEATAEVAVSPPAYCRHGDMLASFTKPARTSFAIQQQNGRWLAKGERPAASADDYGIGDDVLQAIGEARWKGEAGPYSLGFIAEGPEPIWLWENGKAVLKPAAQGETNHLEIALMEKGTMRIVPEAKVSLKLVRDDAPDSATLEFPLYPLMSEFYHYGNTVQVPPGRYQVTARVEPPSFGSLTPGLFEQAVEVRFPWDNRPDVADSATEPAGGPS